MTDATLAAAIDPAVAASARGRIVASPCTCC